MFDGFFFLILSYVYSLVELRDSCTHLNWQRCRSVLSQCWAHQDSNMNDPRVACGASVRVNSCRSLLILGWTLVYISTSLKLGIS